MQGELAQQGERSQDRHPVAVRVLEQAEHLGPLPLEVAGVDAFVVRGERDREDLLLLGWQVPGDL